MRDVLTQLKTRPTFAEQWSHSEAAAALLRGKQRVLRLEAVRGDKLILGDILAQDPDIKEWYDAIAA
jgi:hypothetical protein